jgi:hypothetical protein
LEVIKQISLTIAICVAIYGIDAWRREYKGKRQLKLAEDSLALFYEAEDAIDHMRHPAAYSYETDEVIRGEHEAENNFTARKNAYVVFHRYNNYHELFGKINALRYRFMSQVGKEEAKPFDELRTVVNEIKGSANALSRLWAREIFVTDKKWDEHRIQIAKYEAIFWSGLEDDDLIKSRVNKIISDMETICQSAMSGKGTLHGFLNRRIGLNS